MPQYFAKAGKILLWGLPALLAAVVFYWPLLAHVQDSILAEDPFRQPGYSDSYNALWIHSIIQKAVLQGQSPLHSHEAYPPAGFDLLFHTPVLLSSILSLPVHGLARAWTGQGFSQGVIVSYNLMLVGLLIGAAWMYTAWLRRSFGFGVTVSMVGGIVFGFNPYFQFKALAHPNLLGALFWGGALALWLDALSRAHFCRKRGLLWALLVWATFWNSWLELYMLAIISSLAFLTFIVKNPAFKNKKPWKGLLLWIAALALGTPFLLVIPIAGLEQALMTEPIAEPSWLALLQKPWLQWGAQHASLRLIQEYGGIGLPWVSVGLFVWLTASSAKSLEKNSQPFRGRERLLLLAGLCLLIAWNAGGIPRWILDHLFLGHGFRILPRFYPVFLFLWLPWVFFALEGISKSLLRWMIVVALLFEIYPFYLQPAALPRLSQKILETVRKHPGRVIVMTRRLHPVNYRSWPDAYAVLLESPLLYPSYLARKDPAVDKQALEFARIYLASALPLRDSWVRPARDELGVRWMIFETGILFQEALQGLSLAERAQLQWLKNQTGPEILLDLASVAVVKKAIEPALQK